MNGHTFHVNLSIWKPKKGKWFGKHGASTRCGLLINGQMHSLYTWQLVSEGLGSGSSYVVLPGYYLYCSECLGS